MEPSVPAPRKPLTQWDALKPAAVPVAILLSVIAMIVGAVCVVVPQMPVSNSGPSCLANLDALGALFVQEREAGASSMRSGQSLFLSWRKEGRLIPRGSENVLLCGADNRCRQVATDEDCRSYDDIDLADPPRDRCSYAARDFERFPLPAEETGDEPIAACTHHPKGAHVLFDDGDTRFCDWSDLGLTGASEALVGPDAKSPLLRTLCYRPGVTER